MSAAHGTRATLLLRLAGPLQAWGTQSRFTERDTGIEPSFSGVVGLLCAALGRPREAPLADLATLRFGVRVDREGAMRVDYHTAGGLHLRSDHGKYGVTKPDGSLLPNAVISRRFYLADADFLVGLQGELRFLEELDAALRRPRFPLFLGRKAFVPAVPVALPEISPRGPAIREGGVEEVLRAYPRFVRRRPWEDEEDVVREQRRAVRLVLDAEPGAGSEIRQDVPLSFAERRFGLRYVRHLWVTPEVVLLEDGQL